MLIVFKTTRKQLAHLEKFVLEKHPYDTAEFIVLDIERGTKRYLAVDSIQHRLADVLAHLAATLRSVPQRGALGHRRGDASRFTARVDFALSHPNPLRGYRRAGAGVFDCGARLSACR